MCQHRKAADNLRNQTVSSQVLRGYIPDEIVFVYGGSLLLCHEADNLSIESVCNISFYSLKCSSANKQYVFGIDRYHPLFRMLSSPLRRYVNDASLKNFQK